MPKENIKVDAEELDEFLQGDTKLPSAGALKFAQATHVTRKGHPCCYVDDMCNECFEEIYEFISAKA